MNIQDLKTPVVISELFKNQTSLPHWLPEKLWSYWRLEVYSSLLTLRRMMKLAEVCLVGADEAVKVVHRKESSRIFQLEKDQLAQDFRSRLVTQGFFREANVDKIIEAFKQDLELAQMEVPA